MHQTENWKQWPCSFPEKKLLTDDDGRTPVPIAYQSDSGPQNINFPSML